jgi:hypothetical protein
MKAVKRDDVKTDFILASPFFYRFSTKESLAGAILGRSVRGGLPAEASANSAKGAVQKAQLNLPGKGLKPLANRLQPMSTCYITNPLSLLKELYAHA